MVPLFERYFPLAPLSEELGLQCKYTTWIKCPSEKNAITQITDVIVYHVCFLSSVWFITFFGLSHVLFII